MKEFGTSTRWLVAAAVLAVVMVTAAVLVVTHRGPTSVKKITGTQAGTPGVAWSLDAAKLLGRPFGQFSDSRGGASYQSGQPGFLLLPGDTLVTIAGSPTNGYTLDNAVMVGVDATSGAVRWTTPAADLEQCSPTPLDGEIYCYARGKGSGADLVTYEIASGESARRPVDEFVFGLTTTSDTLYVVEGNPEDNDVRVHAGTFDDVSARWTHAYDVGASWEDVYGGDLLTVADGAGLLQMGGQAAQFDPESGAQLWLGNDFCSTNAALESGGVVLQSDTDCQSSTNLTGQTLRGPGGKVVISTKSPARQRIPVIENDGKGDPILLGDSAYDRVTGERRWTNRDLVTGDGGALGAVTAVVSGVAVTADRDAGDNGVDLQTGKRLWHKGNVVSFTPLAGGDGLIAGTEEQGLAAYDVRTGDRKWTSPFVAIDPDPETFSASGAMKRHGDGWIYSSDRRMIGLAPL